MLAPRWTSFSCRRPPFSHLHRTLGLNLAPWVPFCDFCTGPGSFLADVGTIFGGPDGDLEPQLGPFVPKISTETCTSQARWRILGVSQLDLTKIARNQSTAQNGSVSWKCYQIKHRGFDFQNSSVSTISPISQSFENACFRTKGSCRFTHVRLDSLIPRKVPMLF